MKRIILAIWSNFLVIVLPILAILGLFLGIKTVRAGSQEKPKVAPVVEPARASFDYYVAGAGIIEGKNENIEVASNIAGVVSEVFVEVGKKVKKGEPLFALDQRQIKAQLALSKSSLDVAQAQFVDAQSQYAFLQKISDKRAVSVDEITKKKNAVEIADARVEQAKKGLEATETELSLYTVLAPRDATVLRINIRVGEYASAQKTSTPLMLLAETDSMWVRVDIDENDAWRVKLGAKAEAVLRGNSNKKVRLEFVRFEPYVVPKKSLTGENFERVDSRVLQIIYQFDSEKFPVYVGQLVDVFIEASANE